MSLLIVTDLEDEEYDYDCTSYERRGDLIIVFIDGEKVAELTPDHYGGNSLVFMDMADEEDATFH